MASLKTEGGTGSISKDGVVQESVVYYVSTPEEVLTVGKTPPPGLEETTRNWSALNALDTTGYTVTVTYEGGSQSGDSISSSGTSQDQVYWSYDYNLLEEPIESHWQFEEIKKKYGGWKDPNDEGRWIFADYEPGKEKSKKLSPMKGVRTYMVLHLTVSKNYSAKTLPAGLLSKVGTQTERIKGLDFDKGSRNWLVMPVQATKRGNVWQISESWKLSEKFKWPEEVYGSKKIGIG